MKILVLPGDGIGPEVVEQAKQVLEVCAQRFQFQLVFTEAIVGGAETVWADGAPWPFRILRIDSASKQVTDRIYGAAGLVTFGAGSLWALGHQTVQPSVVRIDADTNRIVATIPLPKFVTDMSFGDGRLWVLGDHYSNGRNNGHVLEIDPKTNTVVRRIPVQNGGPSIWAGGGAVWMQGRSGVLRLDARTGRRSTVALSRNFRPFAYGEGGVWFLGDARLFVFGAVLVLVMILRPQGLIPSRRRAAELTEGDVGADLITDSEEILREG